MTLFKITDAPYNSLLSILLVTKLFAVNLLYCTDRCYRCGGNVRRKSYIYFNVFYLLIFSHSPLSHFLTLDSLSPSLSSCSSLTLQLD
jgi:hypothetical protein